MECTCVRYTELPHATRLFIDLIYHPDRVRAFYPWPPTDPQSFVSAAAQIRFDPKQRAALVAALRELNGDSPNLELLAREGTVAVVTGQQIGLFSGPAYTIYKALTAAKLAHNLNGRGIPAVPIFWLATEDHDFAEISRAWIFDSEHQAIELSIDGPAETNQPVGGIPITSAPIERLRESLASFPFGGEVSDRVAQAYLPGRTLGAAFGQLLSDLLRSFDIPRIDPMQPCVRRLAAPLLREAVGRAPELTRMVLERNRELAAAGYHAQVHVEEQTSFFFFLENGRRLGLLRRNGEYLAPGRRFPAEELMERAEQVSPNALLRPVVQDFLLPTIAYVGGPAELAYLAQSEAIYRALLGRMPVALHRAGFTLLDQHSARLMNRYGLTLRDFFQSEHLFRQQMAAKLVPPELAGTMDETAGAASSAITRLAMELTRFDPTLSKAVTRSREKIEYQISRIRRKVALQTMARNERAARDASQLCGLVFPRRHLQERLYSILPFVAQHGFELIHQLYENVHLDCPDHQLLVI